MHYDSNNNWGWLEKSRFKKDIEFIVGDIRDFDSVYSAMQGVEEVFHLAALIGIPYSYLSPLAYIKTNIEGTYNVLQSAKLLKTKNIVITSTSETYGSAQYVPINEQHPKVGQSPYSASKASADHLIKSYVRTYNLPAIISNCCNNYGPFQFPEKLIPKIITNVLSNKSIPVYAKGLNSREWIYVYDHCDALYQIYKKGKIGESYNVGSNFNLKNINIVKNILKIFRRKGFKIGKNVKVKFVKDRPGHDFRYSLDSRKINKEIKWRSITSITKGLDVTIDWYLQNRKYYKL